MKKIIQFNDALGNTIQLRAVIDITEQLNDKPCWIVESRKVFPQKTDWGSFHKLKNQYYNTEKDAQDAVKGHLADYAEKALSAGKIVSIEETVL